MKQANNRIREEFISKFCSSYGVPVIVDGILENNYSLLGIKNGDEVADWWLSKIAELLKSQREELVEKIESYKKIELLKLRSCENDKINWNYHQGKVHQLEDLLSKTNEKV